MRREGEGRRGRGEGRRYGRLPSSLKRLAISTPSPQCDTKKGVVLLGPGHHATSARPQYIIYVHIRIHVTCTCMYISNLDSALMYC